MFYDVPQNTNISYTVVANGFYTTNKSLKIEDLDYYTEFVHMSVNSDYSLTVGLLSMGNEFRGLFEIMNKYGAIAPTQYGRYPIVKLCYEGAQDMITGDMEFGSLLLEVEGNTETVFPYVIITINNTGYTLNYNAYFGGQTQYYCNVGTNPALFNYLTANANKTINITIASNY